MSGEKESSLGPMQRAQQQMRPELPRRFYTEATVAEAPGGHTVLLDSRSVKTPGKRPLVVPTASLAGRIAGEWQAQGERIDAATMPLTRLANTTIDAVAERMAEVRTDALKYAGFDLLCYRAEHPAELAARQERDWDPVLDWARDRLGAPLATASGIAHRPQPAEAIAAIGRRLERLDPFRLAGVHELTTISGSVVLALAVLDRALTSDAAWTAAHVDEDWQIRHWGEDFEAAERRQIRRRDFEAAARLIELSAVE